MFELAIVNKPWVFELFRFGCKMQYWFCLIYISFNLTPFTSNYCYFKSYILVPLSLRWWVDCIVYTRQAIKALTGWCKCVGWSGPASVIRIHFSHCASYVHFSEIEVLGGKPAEGEIQHVNAQSLSLSPSHVKRDEKYQIIIIFPRWFYCVPTTSVFS